MAQLSEAQRRACAEVFAFYDRSHSGRVAVADLGPALRSAGTFPSEELLGEAAKKYGQGGRVTLVEFEELAARAKIESVEEIINAFSAFDKEGSGTVSVSELQHIVASAGGGLRAGEVADMLTSLGMTGTSVHYEDLVRALKRQ